MGTVDRRAHHIGAGQLHLHIISLATRHVVPNSVRRNGTIVQHGVTLRAEESDASAMRQLSRRKELRRGARLARLEL